MNLASLQYTTTLGRMNLASLQYTTTWVGSTWHLSSIQPHWVGWTWHLSSIQPHWVGWTWHLSSIQPHWVGWWKSMQLDHRVHIEQRWNRASVSALSAGTLHCNFVRDGKWVKDGGRAVHPHLTSQGRFFHHDGMYARNRPLPLCVYSLSWTNWKWARLSLPSTILCIMLVKATYIHYHGPWISPFAWRENWIYRNHGQGPP